MPKWRNRQTRYVQGVVSVTPWEFKSPLRHQVPDPDFRVSTLTNEDEWEGWSLASSPEESPSCTERGCPVKAGEAPPGVDSPDWRAVRRARATETMSSGQCRVEVKRAILPAAISESAASRLLAEAGSREQPRRRRGGRSFGAERDDHHEQNSAYSPFRAPQSSWCL